MSTTRGDPGPLLIVEEPRPMKHLVVSRRSTKNEGNGGLRQFAPKDLFFAGRRTVIRRLLGNKQGAVA